MFKVGEAELFSVGVLYAFLTKQYFQLMMGLLESNTIVSQKALYLL